MRRAEWEDLRGVKQGSPDAPAAMVGADGQAVEVSSPPVPTSDQRADQLGVAYGHQQRSRVTFEQRDYGCAGVSRPALVLRGDLPQLKDRVHSRGTR